MSTPNRTTTPAIMTDLYQLTMTAGYWSDKRTDRATFELFVRHLPAGRGFLLAAGLEEALGYLQNFRFGPDDLEYLRTVPALAQLPGEFFDYLAGLRFT